MASVAEALVTPVLAAAPEPAALPASAEERKRRSRIAEALVMSSLDYSPVQHWSQGLNRVAQGLVGGLEERKLDREARDVFAQQADDVLKHPGLASRASQPSPAASDLQPSQSKVAAAASLPQTTPAPAADRPKVPSSDKVIGDDEAVRLGLYDPPKTPGGTPPVQSDVSLPTISSPAAATPARSTPPPSPAPVAGAQPVRSETPMDEQMQAFIIGLARRAKATGDQGALDYAKSLLAQYSKPPTFKPVNAGNTLIAFNEATGAFGNRIDVDKPSLHMMETPDGQKFTVEYDPVKRTVSLPKDPQGPKPAAAPGTPGAEIERIVGQGGDRGTAKVEATKRAMGETIPAEAAGRIAMIETASKDMAAARRVLEGDWDTQKAAQYYAAKRGLGAAAGETGIAMRNVRVAIEAGLRAMTGAAAPEPEVERYTDMFLPTPFDNATSRKQKLDLLNDFMSNATRLIMQGRTLAPSSAAPAASADAAPAAAKPRRKFNPATGTIE